MGGIGLSGTSLDDMVTILGISQPITPLFSEALAASDPALAAATQPISKL